MYLFVGGNVKLKTNKPKVNNIIKFLFSWDLALRRKCQFNNNFYFSKKYFAKAEI